MVRLLSSTPTSTFPGARYLRPPPALCQTVPSGLEVQDMIDLFLLDLSFSMDLRIWHPTTQLALLTGIWVQLWFNSKFRRCTQMQFKLNNKQRKIAKGLILSNLFFLFLMNIFKKHNFMDFFRYFFYRFST